MQKVRINKIAENDNASVRPILNTVRPAASASEVTTVWRYRNLIIIIIIIEKGLFCPGRGVRSTECPTSQLAYVSAGSDRDDDADETRDVGLRFRATHLATD